MKTKQAPVLTPNKGYHLSTFGLVSLFLIVVGLVFALQFVFGMTQTVLTDNKKLSKSLKIAQLDIDTFKTENDRKNNEIENLLAQYESSDADLKSAKTDLDSTKSNLDTTLSNLGKLKDTLKEQEDALKKQKVSLDAKKSEIKKLLDVQKTTDTRVKDLEEQLDVVASSFGEYKEELDKEKKTLAVKEKTLSDKEKVIEEEVNLD